ncbi:MAG TPA: hypothetical protein EYP68_02490 [Candidatus Korarchaeota archaeon]|nr:hypothetical protein [Candidatus Korarchaeota archaeon]
MKSRKFKVKAIKTSYWKPNTNYLERIVNAITGEVEDGDIVAVSEKAISVALGNIVDESQVRPGILAYFLALVWMRIVWGYFLGPVLKMKRENINRFRSYPIPEGARHKQVCINEVGFFSALRHGSEGGIDGSNVAYSFVALPLKQADQIAKEIRDEIVRRTGKGVGVLIVDSDKTYSTRSIHITPRKSFIPGIRDLGPIAYFIGRLFKLKRRSTPVAACGICAGIEEILDIAEVVDRARGHGAGPTVWDMAERFGTSLTGVSWEMLDEVDHRPIVIVKRKDDCGTKTRKKKER